MQDHRIEAPTESILQHTNRLVHADVCACACMRAYVHACMRVRMFACACVRARACTRIHARACALVRVRLRVRACAHANECVCVCIRACARIHACVRVCLHVVPICWRPWQCNLHLPDAHLLSLSINSSFSFAHRMTSMPRTIGR